MIPDQGINCTRQIPFPLKCWGLAEQSRACRPSSTSGWVPCAVEDAKKTQLGRGGPNDRHIACQRFLTMWWRNDVHQRSGEDYLIRLSIPMWWVLKRILGLNEWFQRRKDEEARETWQKTEGQGRVWETRGDWAGHRNHSKHETSLKVRNMWIVISLAGIQKRVEIVEPRTVSLEGSNSHPSKGFQCGFWGGWGQCWNGAVSGVSVLCRLNGLGGQPLGCYCSCPCVKQHALMNPWHGGCLIGWLPLHIKLMACYMPRLHH